jgi:hypothetical protein
MDTSGVDPLWSTSADTLLSLREKQFFKRVFAASRKEQEESTPNRPVAPSGGKPHTGGKLDMKA